MATVVGMLALGATLPGCGWIGQKSLPQRLQSEDPAERLDAVVEAENQRSRRAVPYLVDRLSDSEREVRMFAAVALRRITGEDMGYRHYDPASERREAIDRWRQWVRSHYRTETRDPNGGGDRS
jgi:hypothetical protein